MVRFALVLSLLVAGCGDGSSNENNGSSNTTAATNNGTAGANNGSTNNATSGTTGTTGTSNNQTTSTNNQTSCTPVTCADLSAMCGSPDDGCGTPLDCGACPSGEACLEGMCETGVGAPCGADVDCAEGLTCYLQTEAGWTGGYCQTACASNDDCPSGSHCATDVCVKSCDSGADCRADYACFDGDDDQAAECLPVGSGTGEVGDPCTSYADCAGDELGACIVESGEDFIGGYCTIVGCTVDSGCPAGSNCLDATSPPICLLNCTSDAECRGEYECRMATEAGDSCIPAGL